MKILKICPRCKEEFESYKCQHRTYCSRKCHYDTQKTNCLTCGKEIIFSKSHKRKYCNWACRDIGSIGKTKGEKNGMWKGKVRRTKEVF